MNDHNEYYTQRLEKLNWLKENRPTAYPNHYRPTHQSVAIISEYDSQSKEELQEQKVQVAIAGRVMFLRSFGKAAFVKVRDRSGEIQCYLQKNSLGDAAFEIYKKLDVGDLVYCSGYLFRTKTDELSIHVEEFDICTKGLQSLPEKFHGLTDVELRYRQRYLDLIMNQEVQGTFKSRSKIVQLIREFFVQRDYLECETPMMHSIPGGAKARPFVTHHNTLEMELYLRIAPELYLKRLIVGGFERVFEVNRNFRNEGISIQHNPEFTMLEFYQAYADYNDLMQLTEELFDHLAREVCGQSQFDYQGTELSFKAPFKKIRLYDSLIEYAGAPQEILTDKVAALDFAKQKNIELKSKDSELPIILTELFEELVEAQLIQPTFVTHFPAAVSPLSRRSDAEPELTERFELFIYGREIANGFSELNDPIDQKQRFESQIKEREQGDEEAMYFDADFVRALEFGMPPTAGEGIGIDRLVMLLTNAASIRDVILFPLMKIKKSTHE